MSQLNLNANHKQRRAMEILGDKQTTRLGFGGGAGGGKSYLLVMWQWVCCQKYPGYRGFFGRKELKRLKQTTLESYYKFCHDYGIETQQGHLNQQDSEIVFQNGSKILLLDLAYQPSDPLYQRLGSLELTGGGVDESAEVDERALQILATRVGRHMNKDFGLIPKLLETFNPDKGHVYRDFYKPYKEGTLPEHMAFIPSLATDNSFISPDYITQLERSDTVTRERLLHGNFDYDDTPGKLFVYDAILEMWTNEIEPGITYITCDVARMGRDKTIMFVWSGFQIIEMVKIDKASLDEQATQLKNLCRKHGVPMRRVICDENGVGGGLIDMLQCKGFINNARPIQSYKTTGFTYERNSLKRNFENLKCQCYYELAKYVNENKISVKIDDSELKSKLTEELDVVCQIDLDKDGTIKITRKEDIISKLARSPDYSDAMMMRMLFEIGRTENQTADPIEETINDTPYSHIFLDGKSLNAQWDIETKSYTAEKEEDDEPYGF